MQYDEWLEKIRSLEEDYGLEQVCRDRSWEEDFDKGLTPEDAFFSFYEEEIGE